MKKLVLSIASIALLLGCSDGSQNLPAYLPGYAVQNANQNARQTTAPSLPSPTVPALGQANGLLSAETPTDDECEAAKQLCAEHSSDGSDADSSEDGTQVTVHAQTICVLCQARIGQIDIGPGSVIPYGATDLRGIPFQQIGPQYSVPFQVAPGVLGPVGSQFINPATALNQVFVGGPGWGRMIPFQTSAYQGLNQQYLAAACGGRITVTCLQRVDTQVFVQGSVLCTCMDKRASGTLSPGDQSRCQDVADSLSLGEEWSAWGNDMKEIGKEALSDLTHIASWLVRSPLGSVRQAADRQMIRQAQQRQTSLFATARLRGFSCGGSVTVSSCSCVSSEYVCGPSI
ncbi:MAG TPA: hypothetical protein VI895_14915 [Bdellovibrionota bacterium]|nr:hypothetical protein [Bdellovibrionota bacterium]